jgi:hypothetical protein
MKCTFAVISAILLAGTVNAEDWIKVEFDPVNPKILVLVKSGVIESESENSKQGRMLLNDFNYYVQYFNLQPIKKETRQPNPFQLSSSPDSLGEILAIYPMPPQVQSERGMAYLDGYFYIADARTGAEQIHKLDPGDNFRVVKSFLSPGPGSLLPWGVASDGKNLYVADAIHDMIFKIDSTGAIRTIFGAGGPIATGLGYRMDELWNADLGDFLQGIPPKMYVSDTTGAQLTNYQIPNTINGVAAHDSAVFVSRNQNNGKDIRAMDPATFTQLYSFSSPLDFPNGLAFDGTYLWICGRDGGVQYIVQMDLGIDQPPPPPKPIDWRPFTLVEDGMFNNRFDAAFDSEGKIHLVYATQFETVSSTKEIMYGTNKSGVWELKQITHDPLTDELPVIQIDDNDIVHIMWNRFSSQDNDVELFYTNNSDSGGTFHPKIQITSMAVDGLQGHTWPSFAVQNNGMVHFAFVDAPIVGAPEAYYGTYFQGVTSPIVNISNNGDFDSDPLILLDSLNNPHTFWNDLSTGLNHATNASGNWEKEFVTQMGSSRPGAAIDSQGVIHFVVTRNEVVKYGNNAGGSFSVTDTLAVHTENCFYPDMAVDDSGGIHITYHSFGDSLNSWPGIGEIFYTNNDWWEAGKFPQNVSQLPSEQEIYPGMAVNSSDEIVIGWAQTGVTEGVFSNIRMATTLPDSGGLLSGRINLSDEYHHFGFVAPLDSVFWDFEIYNFGTRPLSISEIIWQASFEPPYMVTTDFNAPQIINTRDTLTVTVKAFIDAPVRTDTTQFDGLLKIMSDDPIEPEKNILLQVETEIVGVNNDIPGIITTNKLYPNFPNPFNPTTTIHFSVAKNSDVKLQIFNITGQLVRILIDQKYPGGSHSVDWDGRDEKGNLQPSGIYFYQMTVAGLFMKSRQMVLLR